MNINKRHDTKCECVTHREHDTRYLLHSCKYFIRCCTSSQQLVHVCELSCCNCKVPKRPSFFPRGNINAWFRFKWHHCVVVIALQVGAPERIFRIPETPVNPTLAIKKNPPAFYRRGRFLCRTRVALNVQPVSFGYVRDFCMVIN